MKQMILIFLTAISLFSFSAQAGFQTCDQADLFDRPVPWPWGLEQPFPWTDIKGVWRIEKSSVTGYFTFKVLRQKANSEDRYLVVRQIDPDTCHVVADGFAYELNKVVRGQMTTKEGIPFRIAVRAFREEDSPQAMAGPIETTQVMVLSIMGLSDDEPKLHVQIGKVQESIDLKRCSNLKK